MKIKALLSLVLAGAVVCGPVAAGDREEVGAVYASHIQGMKDKNLAQVIDTLHPQSPAYGQAKAGVAQTMINFDLAYKILTFDLVGVTGDFAVIRVKLETRKIGGEAKFEDNVLDSLQVFRRAADGKWKIWSSCVLDVQPLNPPQPAKK